MELWQECAKMQVLKVLINHSVIVTRATCLFQAGIDEQLIMERTGHRSTDGIRVYKHTNSEQQEQISDILLHSKKPKEDTSPNGVIVPSTSTPFTATNTTSASGSVESTYVMHSQSQ